MVTIRSTDHQNPTSITRGIASEQIIESEGTVPLLLETHYTTSINLGWQKLDHYYNKTDVTPIHRAAVFLHPRLKWRWFERQWRERQGWITDAKLARQELWSKYKDKGVTTAPTTATATSKAKPTRDEWCDNDPEADLDQLEQYESEAYARDFTDSDYHIPYWVAKQPIWPQLAQMAVDNYSTPAMSD